MKKMMITALITMCFSAHSQQVENIQDYDVVNLRNCERDIRIDTFHSQTNDKVITLMTGVHCFSKNHQCQQQQMQSSHPRNIRYLNEIVYLYSGEAKYHGGRLYVCH